MPLLCCSRIISVSRSRLVYGFVSTLYLARTSTGVLPRSKKSKGAVNKCVVYGQRLFPLGFCSLPGLFIVPDDYNKKRRAEKTGKLMFDLLLRRIAGLKPLKPA